MDDGLAAGNDKVRAVAGGVQLRNALYRARP
jgi:hypothetical protein